MCMCTVDHNTAQEVASKVRLPGTVIPEHYALTLRPDLTNFTFTGGVVIDVEVAEASSQIVLNASELTISGAHITDSTGSRLVGTVTLDEENERAIIGFAGVVGKGKWKLHLSFAGILNNKLHGFYRSVYKDASGKEHVIASTQFEPNDARRAFPCFDEPSFKATFDITLVVDEHLTAISNGEIVKETVVEEQAERVVDYGNGLKYVVAPARRKRVVEFATTMKQSTYIVAFVVGEFERTEAVNVDGTEVRIYHVPGKSALTTFGLKAAQFSLAWFENYFGIKYPGGKMDLIGIPDFAFGAMENTGCITFRETALLVSEETATIGELSRVAEVVAHEIAHQWFGNLVTMKWWNGLWLNEAFATFMATKVQADFRPLWDRWTNFGIERAAAFRTDGLLSTRAIEAPVAHPSQALGMIDVITYRKGCSVLRQLEQYIGEAAFRRGVGNYLRKHSYGNTENSDLWDAIGAACSYPVREIMDKWVFQPGYPVVTVSESEIAGSVTLSQAPFKYLNAEVDSSQLWPVPVCLRYSSGEGEQTQWVLLDTRERTVYLGENVAWAIANAGGHGFYRTAYSGKLAADIASSLPKLPAIERFNLINDAWACVQSGLQSSSQYLDTVRLYNTETDPNVWAIVASSLGRLHGMLPDGDKSKFETLVREVARPTFDRLGWKSKEGETAQDRQVRGTVIGLLGTAGGDTSLLNEADTLFTAYLGGDRKALPSDVVPTAVGLVAHDGGEAEYNEFKRLMTSTNVPQEAVRYLMALAGFRKKELLERTLKAVLDGTARTQDAPALLVRLLGNSVIQRDTWEFLKKNWSTMVATFPETGLISMVSGIVALDAPDLADDVRAFFAANSVKGGDKAVAQSLELLSIGALFTTREQKPLTAAFASASTEPAASTESVS